MVLSSLMGVKIVWNGDERGLAVEYEKTRERVSVSDFRDLEI